MNEIEQNLQNLGVVLPKAPGSMGNFLPSLIDGPHLYISGQVSKDATGSVIKGKLGESLDLADGQEAAKYCAMVCWHEPKRRLATWAG